MMHPGPCGGCWWCLMHSYSGGATTIQNIINQISHHISYNGQAETTNVTSEQSMVCLAPGSSHGMDIFL